MTSDSRSFDVCIVCALAEEARIVLDVIARRCHATFAKGFSAGNTYEYRSTTIRNTEGEPLAIHVSWPPDVGSLETGLHFKPILKEVRPRFAAMTGICAGDKRKVQLGDLIIADRAFFFDTGKIMTDESGLPVHLHDVKTYHADPSVLQAARLFESWRTAVARLKRPASRHQQRDWLLAQLLEAATARVEQIPLQALARHAPDWRLLVLELQHGADPYLASDGSLLNPSRVERLRYGSEPFPFRDPPRPTAYIAPMASGSAVRSDAPFNEVQVPVRGTVAIDMEGAAFYRTVQEFQGIRPLLVKGVSDYADRDKDDTYHHYAAVVAATYLLCFIQTYVTQERMPRVNPPQPQSKADPPALWHVPSRRNPFFTGREDILRRLHDKLTTTGFAALTQPQAISGLGGMGKTQIALEYAYRYRERYRSIFWVRAATPETLITDFVTIADLLQVPERHEQDQKQVIAAVKRWLATHNQWLLILDNADDVAMVSDFVPTDTKGHIVLTSRAQAMGALAQRIDVEKMGMVEGTLFLLHRTKLLAPDAFLDQASEEHLAGAEAIVIAMDFLPLALDQAGAYIDEIGCSLATYLDLYRTHRKALLQRHSRLPTDHPEPVATTWSLSFQKIEQANPAAADLLRLCAFLEPDTIPEDLLSDGRAHLGPALQRVAADALTLNEAIEELRKFSLIQRNPDTKLLSVHRLVQAVLRDAMQRRTQRRWATRAVQAVNAAFPDAVQMETWPLCRRYLSQAQACTVLIQDYALAFQGAAQLLNRTALYLRTQALYELAEPLCQSALRIWEQVLGLDHPQVASALNGLANIYQQQGRFVEAEPLYQRARIIWERAEGPEHPQVATALNNLAGLYFEQGRYAEAESCYLQTLHIWEQTLGPEHSQVASPLNGLANIYYQQGRFAEAESLYLRALHIWEQTLGPDHLQVAYPLNGLANIFYQQDKHTEAESLYLRALHIWEQALGVEHPQLASALNGLANIYFEQGRDDEAEPLYKRVLRIREQALGPDHPQVATALNGLANTSHHLGRFVEAESLYLRALHIWEQALGPQHLHLAHPLNGLANLYFELGKYSQAEPLYKQALAICEQQLGIDHPQTLVARENYTLLLQTMEQDPEEAG